MSCGSTAMPPRRATVSAMRRPATAVMLATTTGSVVPTPSGVVRSTSRRDGTSRAAGHHEHVVVGEVERRGGVGEEAHGRAPCGWCPGGPLRLPGRRSPHRAGRLRCRPCAANRSSWSTAGAARSPRRGRRPGWEALLQDAGRTVIGVDLLGHGTAPKPHDPAEYADLTTRIVDALPDRGPVDAIGFSMGAMTLLELAMRAPERFGRLVVAGIGKNVFDDDPERPQRSSSTPSRARRRRQRRPPVRPVRRPAGQRRRRPRRRDAAHRRPPHDGAAGRRHLPGAGRARRQGLRRPGAIRSSRRCPMPGWSR